MCCFFTKRTLATATLGIGLHIAQAKGGSKWCSVCGEWRCSRDAAKHMVQRASGNFKCRSCVGETSIFEKKVPRNGYGVEIKTQMDILSLSAWTSGCRTGVWGETMTHFLPLVMNREHSDRSYRDIRRFLGLISSQIRAHNKEKASRNAVPNELEKAISCNVELQMVDSLVTMMNAIVIQFAMGSDKFVSDYEKGLNWTGYGSHSGPRAEVPMTMCEKVVLGYSALHHLLLYLQHRNQTQVTWLANETVSIFVHKMRSSGKHVCKDVGKMLIYLLISDYSWAHIAKTHVEETFTRRVKWMVQQPQYAKFDTTDSVANRVQQTFEATQTARRLTRFQVWFMQSNAHETLQSYNRRLGRPDEKVRYGIVAQTKRILMSDSFWEYFKALGVELKDEADIDQLLRFAVCNSARKGYHRRGGGGSSFLPITDVKMPPIVGEKAGPIHKPGQRGSRNFATGKVALKISAKPKTNPWGTKRKWGAPKANAPTPMQKPSTQTAARMQQTRAPTRPMQPKPMNVRAQTQSRPPMRPQHIMTQSQGRPRRAQPTGRAGRGPDRPSRGPLRHAAPAQAQSHGQSATQQGRPRAAHGPTRPPVMRSVQNQPVMTQLETAGTAPSQMASSRLPSSNSFAYVDNSTNVNSSVPDDTEMPSLDFASAQNHTGSISEQPQTQLETADTAPSQMARLEFTGATSSRLPSAKPFAYEDNAMNVNSSVPNGTVMPLDFASAENHTGSISQTGRDSPLVPLERIAQRDVDDFTSQRDAVDARTPTGDVTRQLQTVETAADEPAESAESEESDAAPSEPLEVQNQTQPTRSKQEKPEKNTQLIYVFDAERCEWRPSNEQKKTSRARPTQPPSQNGHIEAATITNSTPKRRRRRKKKGRSTRESRSRAADVNNESEEPQVSAEVVTVQDAIVDDHSGSEEKDDTQTLEEMQEDDGAQQTIDTAAEAAEATAAQPRRKRKKRRKKKPTTTSDIEVQEERDPIEVVIDQIVQGHPQFAADRDLLRSVVLELNLSSFDAQNPEMERDLLDCIIKHKKAVLTTVAEDTTELEEEEEEKEEKDDGARETIDGAEETTDGAAEVTAAQPRRKRKKKRKKKPRDQIEVVIDQITQEYPSLAPDRDLLRSVVMELNLTSFDAQNPEMKGELLDCIIKHEENTTGSEDEDDGAEETIDGAAENVVQKGEAVEADKVEQADAEKADQNGREKAANVTKNEPKRTEVVVQKGSKRTKGASSASSRSPKRRERAQIAAQKKAKKEQVRSGAAVRKERQKLAKRKKPQKAKAKAKAKAKVNNARNAEPKKKEKKQRQKRADTRRETPADVKEQQAPITCLVGVGLVMASSFVWMAMVSSA